jgi:hypothetical protein
MSEYILVDGELCHTDELMHYRVLGMKWGHRKSRSHSLVSKSGRKTRSTSTRKRTIDANKVEKGKQFVKTAVAPITIGAVGTALAISGMSFAAPIVTALGNVAVNSINVDNSKLQNKANK